MLSKKFVLRQTLALAAASSLAASPALAQVITDKTDPATALAEITNTATRTDRRVDDVPNTVTVLPARSIELTGARDVKDLFRNEVDLSVRSAPTRFGAAGSATGRAGVEGINVRGLEGNQVLLLVDGIRVPNSFSFGAFATGRADFLALDGAQAVEVLRGPASTQFGSDGLAGAVSLRTLEPADVLKKGQGLAGFVRLGGSALDDSRAITATIATRQGDWQTLLLAGHRDGHETGNQGSNEALNSNRTAPNPLDYRHSSVLGKAIYQFSATQRLGATVDVVQRRQNTEVYSGRAVPPAPPAVLASTAVIDLDARDRVQRQRVSIDHRYDDLNGAWMQKAETRLYAQDADVWQFSAEDRNTAADRTRNNRYRQKVVGASTQFESNLAGAFGTGVNQRLSGGADASRSEISAVRDGTPTPSAPPPFGENFPTKPFPDTRYTLLGAFVQSEVEAGAVTLIPGLRYDRYRLQPSTSGYTGGAVTTLSDQAVTPRLGLIWRASPLLAPYLQLAKGFRAPTPDQVNNGFTNVAAGYRSEGNPNLKAESAQSIEIGLRGVAGGVHWQLTAYRNRYRDFISQEVVSGSGSTADPSVFKYINLASARIQGLELRADWKINAQWSASAAAASARGTSTRGAAEGPLDSVEPARTTLGLRYAAAAWELRADVLHAAAKAPGRIRSTTPAAFAPPGYTVLDFSARWQPLPAWTVIAQLNNATDESYWRWSDVRGLADNSLVKDNYTAPGRHAQIALRYDF